MANELATRSSGTSIVGLRERFNAMRNKMGAVNAKAGEAIEGVVTAFEIQGSAFLFGALQGAFYEPNPKKPGDLPGVHILGVPVEAVAGLGLVLGGFLGVGGTKWSHHMQNLGNGALAAWTSNLGRGFGFKFRSERDARRMSRGGMQGDAIEGEEPSLRDQVSALLNGEDV